MGITRAKKDLRADRCDESLMTRAETQYEPRDALQPQPGELIYTGITPGQKDPSKNTLRPAMKTVPQTTFSGKFLLAYAVRNVSVLVDSAIRALKNV